MKTSGFFTLTAIVLTMNMNAETFSQNQLASANNYKKTFLTYLSTVKETSVEVADWMLDVNAFESQPEMIDIEDWMLDVNAFTESDNRIENGILDETLFKAYDETVEIEDWMLDVKGFMHKRNSAEMECWMLDLATFD